MIRAELHFRAYSLIERALEEGSLHGWHQAHKHVSNPPAEDILQQIVANQMLALLEILDFGKEPE